MKVNLPVGLYSSMGYSLLDVTLGILTSQDRAPKKLRKKPLKLSKYYHGGLVF